MGGGEIRGFKTGEDEVVDAGGGPGGVFDLWNGVFKGWFKRPELAAFFKVDFGRGLFALALTWVGCAHRNPVFELLDFGIKEAIFGRHFKVTIGMGDGVEEERFLGLSGDDRGAGITAGLPACAGVEEEVGLEFFGVRRVALVAMLDEKGADVVFEVCGASGVICVRQ